MHDLLLPPRPCLLCLPAFLINSSLSTCVGTTIFTFHEPASSARHVRDGQGRYKTQRALPISPVYTVSTGPTSGNSHPEPRDGLSIGAQARVQVDLLPRIKEFSPSICTLHREEQ